MSKKLDASSAHPAGDFFFARLIWALLAAVAGAGLLQYSKIDPLAAETLFLMLGLAVLGHWLSQHAWLLYLPALLPVVDWVPYTGEMNATAADALSLSVAMTGYLRLMAFPVPPPWALRRASKPSLLSIAVILLLTIAYGVSAARGFLPYTPAGWQFASYHNHWNALRIAKGFFLPLLLLPLLVRALREEGAVALERFSLGLFLGLMTVTLVGLYERLAYPGLLNFSSSYHITASFWEMHVGGAALEGWLVLSLPFAVWAILHSDRVPTLILALLSASLAFYVTLVTFSRGLYAACAISALVWMLTYRPVGWEEKRTHNGSSGPSLWAGLLILVILYWGMRTVFLSGGYRTLAAFAVLVPAGHLAILAGHRSRFGAWSLGLLFFGLLIVPEVGFFLLLDKGAYWAFALSLAMLFAALTTCRRMPTEWVAGGVLAAWGGLMMAVALIALHWGGLPAFYDCLVVEGVQVLLVLFYCGQLKPLPEWHIRQTLSLAGLAAVMALTVGVPGGYYMGTRFSNTQHDLASREKHWYEAFNWLETGKDLAFGKGLGRFPETYYWNAPLQEMPGVHGFYLEEGNGFLRLSSARHPLEWKNMWRVLQLLPVDTTGPLTFRANVRVQEPATLFVEVCDRHLVYASACSTSSLTVKAGPEAWQTVEIPMEERNEAGREKGIPRMRWFALGLSSSHSLVDVDNVRLEDKYGSSLLRNGDYSGGGDYWFASSDQDQMPWHVKNLLMNMLFDQGLLGLLAFFALYLAAVVRALARINTWPMASFFLASLAGFLVVGLFDGLLDVPRLAMLFYLMCFMLLVVQPDQFNLKKRTHRSFRESFLSPETQESRGSRNHRQHFLNRRFYFSALLIGFLLVGAFTTWLDAPFWSVLFHMKDYAFKLVKIMLMALAPG